MNYIEHTISPENHCIVVTVHGKPGLPEYLRIVDDVENDPAYRTDLNRVCDFTKSAGATLSTMELLRFVARLRKFPIDPETKTALIAPHGVSWIFLSMLVSQVSRGTYQQFETLEAGLNWLNFELELAKLDEAV